MEKDDGLTDASRPRGVIVETRAIEVDELTAHVGAGEGGAGWGARGRPWAKMSEARIRDKRRRMHRGPAMQSPARASIKFVLR